MTAEFRCPCGARAKIDDSATPEQQAEFDATVRAHWGS